MNIYHFSFSIWKLESESKKTWQDKVLLVNQVCWKCKDNQVNCQFYCGKFGVLLKNAFLCTNKPKYNDIEITKNAL